MLCFRFHFNLLKTVFFNNFTLTHMLILGSVLFHLQIFGDLLNIILFLISSSTLFWSDYILCMIAILLNLSCFFMSQNMFYLGVCSICFWENVHSGWMEYSRSNWLTVLFMLSYPYWFLNVFFYYWERTDEVTKYSCVFVFFSFYFWQVLPHVLKLCCIYFQILCPLG